VGRAAVKARTFRLRLQDNDRYEDISEVQVLFADSPNTPTAGSVHSCYVQVNRATQIATLANAYAWGFADSGQLGATNKTLANGRCTIDLGQSSVAVESLNVMILTLRVSEFRPTTISAYYLRAHVLDSGGYQDTPAWSSWGSWTPPSATPPTITSTAAPWVGGTSAAIRWTTNIGTTTRVDYGLTPSYGATTENTAFTIDHAVLLSGLNPGATYYYKIVSRSVDGLTVEQPGGPITAGSISSQPIGIFNTGVSDTSQLLPAGGQDSHYTLVSEPPGGTISPRNSFVVNDGWPIGGGLWLDNTAQSKWIGPTATQGTAYGANGTYKYRTTFDLTGKNPATAVLRGRFAADNQAILSLNGQPLVAAPGFMGWTDFLIHSGFLSGLNNTLEVEVENATQSSSPTGLRLEIGGNVAPLPAGPLECRAFEQPSGNCDHTSFRTGIHHERQFRHYSDCGWDGDDHRESRRREQREQGSHGEPSRGPGQR
jgi:hypothetical protein